MKYVAGLLIFIGFAGSVAFADDYVRTRPYGDGISASARVVDNKGDGVYHNPIVEFRLADGSFQSSQLSAEGWIQPGTLLTISYRADDLTTVRAPELRTINPGYVLLFLASAVGGVALFRSPWIDRKNRPLLNGATIREPEILLSELTLHAGAVLGDIETAFPVIERRSLVQSMIPLGSVACGLAASAFFIDSEKANALALIGIGALVVMLSIVARRRRSGAVVVTPHEFVLVVAAKGDLRKTTIEARLPRSTALPVARLYRGSIVGGPVPFPISRSAQGWYYRGDNLGGGLTFLDIIGGLIVDSSARSSTQDTQASSSRLTDLVADFAADRSIAATPAARRAGSQTTTPADYLHHVADLMPLTNALVDAALPVRPIRNRGVLVEYVLPRRKRSVLVTANNYVIVKHRSATGAGRVLSSHDRGTTSLADALAAANHRIDRGLSWVIELANELQSEDTKRLPHVYPAS